MKLPILAAVKKHKAASMILAGTFVVVIVLGAWQFMTVRKAHSSFENYYKFRGCQELLSKSDNDATCRLATGKTIELVKDNGKWYLAGDLPVCWLGKALCL